MLDRLRLGLGVVLWLRLRLRVRRRWRSIAGILLLGYDGRLSLRIRAARRRLRARKGIVSTLLGLLLQPLLLVLVLVVAVHEVAAHDQFQPA